MLHLPLAPARSTVDESWRPQRCSITPIPLGSIVIRAHPWSPVTRIVALAPRRLQERCGGDVAGATARDRPDGKRPSGIRCSTAWMLQRDGAALRGSADQIALDLDSPGMDAGEPRA